MIGVSGIRNVHTYTCIFSIGDAYQHIVDRALSVPANTMELMQLREFINVSEAESAIRLKTRLQEIIRYINFLSDYSILSPVELKTNNFPFQWCV